MKVAVGNVQLHGGDDQVDAFFPQFLTVNLKGGGHAPDIQIRIFFFQAGGQQPGTADTGRTDDDHGNLLFQFLQTLFCHDKINGDESGLAGRHGLDAQCRTQRGHTFLAGLVHYRITLLKITEERVLHGNSRPESCDGRLDMGAQFPQQPRVIHKVEPQNLADPPDDGQGDLVYVQVSDLRQIPLIRRPDAESGEIGGQKQGLLHRDGQLVALAQDAHDILGHRVFRLDGDLGEGLPCLRDKAVGLHPLNGESDIDEQVEIPAVGQMQVQLLLTVREDIVDFQKGLLMGTAGKGVVVRGQFIFLNLSQSQIVIDPIVDPGGDSLPPGDLRPLDEEAQSLPPDQRQVVSGEPVAQMIEIGAQGSLGDTELVGEIKGLQRFVGKKKLPADETLSLLTVLSRCMRAFGLIQKGEQFLPARFRFVQKQSHTPLSHKMISPGSKPFFHGGKLPLHRTVAHGQFLRDDPDGDRVILREAGEDPYDIFSALCKLHSILSFYVKMKLKMKHRIIKNYFLLYRTLSDLKTKK